MRAHIPSYEMKTPGSLAEAATLLSKEPNRWKPFAGGTDLMVVLETGRLIHKNYLNLSSLGELRGIQCAPDRVTLGALTTFSEIQKNETLQTEFPMLCEASRVTGAVAIQNRGTLGGNIANASPAADSPPALLCYEAELELLSAGGVRTVAYSDFHTGYKTTLLRADELITRIHLPRTKAPLKHFYRKVGTREAQAISKVCFAGLLSLKDGKIQDIRISLGSVAPVPLQCVKTEAVLRGQLLSAAPSGLFSKARAVFESEISPIDDIRSTTLYRRQVACNLLHEFLS